MLVTKLFKCTQQEFDNLKTTEKVPLHCPVCNKDFSRTKKRLLENNKKGLVLKYCSNACQKFLKTQEVTKECSCLNCFKTIFKKGWELRKSKNTFCSKTCATTYNNKNKTHGTRRSKLEKYLEKQFAFLYPDLEILYANKQVIGAELDIYIPSLKLAFEIQGIFHYKPIYGQAKLESIQKNDLEKIKKCKESNINLIHIDVSKQSKVNPNTSNEYLKEICNIIESNRLLRT